MLINGVLEKPIVEYSNYSLSHPIPLCPVLSIFCPFQGWFSLKMRIFFFYKPSSVSDIASESQLEKEWSQLKKEWRPSLGGCSALCPRDGHRAKKKKNQRDSGWTLLCLFPAHLANTGPTLPQRLSLKIRLTGLLSLFHSSQYSISHEVGFLGTTGGPSLQVQCSMYVCDCALLSPVAHHCPEWM